jgi:hypothetical protein
MIEVAIAPNDSSRDDAVWRLLTNDRSKPRHEALSGHHGGHKPSIICIEWAGGVEQFRGTVEAAEWLGTALDRFCNLSKEPREIVVRGKHYRVWKDKEMV